jgi:hypothetical protein
MICPTEFVYESGGCSACLFSFYLLLVSIGCMNNRYHIVVKLHIYCIFGKEGKMKFSSKMNAFTCHNCIFLESRYMEKLVYDRTQRGLNISLPQPGL